MKRIKNLAACLLAILLPCTLPINAQTSEVKDLEAIDLKLDLAQTKLELLDSRIRLWEEKPAALELKLHDLEEQMGQLAVTPEQFNEKYLLMDSLLAEQQWMMTENRVLLERINEHWEQGSTSVGGGSEPAILPGTISGPDSSGVYDLASISGDDPGPGSLSGATANPEPDVTPPRYVISIYPIRIFEGTIQLSVERVLNKGNAIEVSGMATYAAREGVANYYLANQSLDYFNAALDAYVPYESENISGFGASVGWRNYLLPRTKPRFSAPRGAYAAPTLMYRRLILSGFDYVTDEVTGETERIEVQQNLNVFTMGVLAGWQFILWNSLSADLYVGGIVRLAKYDGDAAFTKYKQVKNIDFSGVMPTFGVKIGIVK